MQYTFPTTADIGSVSGKAVPEPGDGQITIPPLFLKTSDIPLVLVPKVSFSAEAENYSMITTGAVQTSQAGTGSVRQGIMAGAKGYWEFWIHVTLRANPHSTMGNVPHSMVSIQSLDGLVSFGILGTAMVPFNGDPWGIEVDIYRKLLIRDDWRIENLITSTNAGTTVVAWTSGQANRLG